MHKLVKVDHIGPFWNLSPDEQAALDTACADLATAGITIEHRPIPWFDEAISLKIYGGLSVPFCAGRSISDQRNAVDGKRAELRQDHGGHLAGARACRLAATADRGPDGRRRRADSGDNRASPADCRAGESKSNPVHGFHVDLLADGTPRPSRCRSVSAQQPASPSGCRSSGVIGETTSCCGSRRRSMPICRGSRRR